MNPSWKTNKIKTSAGMETVDETVARAKRQLAGMDTAKKDTPPLAGLRTLGDVNTSLNNYSSDLSNVMGSSLGKQTKTIMENFASRANLAKEGGIAERKLTEQNFGDKIAGQLDENARSYTQASEGRSGFGTQTAAVKFLEDSGAKRVRELEKQRDSLILESKVAEASRLDSLIEKEQTAITDARTKWVEGLMNFASEDRATSAENRAVSEANRAILGFETPEQTRTAEFGITQKTALNELAISAPDAGILATDDFNTAIEKYRNSTTYKNNQKLGELAIQQAEADIQNTKSLASNRSLGGTGGGAGGGSYSSVGNNTTPDELRNIAFNNVPNLIPSKFGQQQYFKSLNAAKDTEQIRDIMVSTILANSPATVQDSYNKRNDAAGEVGAALLLLEGGAKTGFAQNAFQGVANFFGTDYDPKLAEIKAHLTAAIQPYRSDVTGAAWGSQEQAEYDALIGTTKYEPEALKNRLRNFQNMLRRKNKNAVINAVAPVSQYDVFGGTQQGGGSSAPADSTGLDSNNI